MSSLVKEEPAARETPAESVFRVSPTNTGASSLQTAIRTAAGFELPRGTPSLLILKPGDSAHEMVGPFMAQAIANGEVDVAVADYISADFAHCADVECEEVQGVSLRHILARGLGVCAYQKCAGGVRCRYARNPESVEMATAALVSPLMGSARALCLATKTDTRLNLLDSVCNVRLGHLPQDQETKGRGLPRPIMAVGCASCQGEYKKAHEFEKPHLKMRQIMRIRAALAGNANPAPTNEDPPAP